MAISSGTLLEADSWTPMKIEGQQENPAYYWEDGRLLKDSPADFAKTFDGAMFTNLTNIDVVRFNRNPLRVIPNFTVPRHYHNIDETVLVFEGEYTIEHGYPDNIQTVRVGPGNFFTSRAGTPYTMTAGPEGVTYIETWGVPVTQLKTMWMDFGWVHK